jgi:hypothetical protein
MLSPLRSRAGKRLREPFGKAGLTVAVIALVFAMLGGAYAAGGLTSKQKKEVKAIAKGFQGTGPAGPQGPAGAKGDSGAAGSSGAAGKDGASPVGTSFSGSKTLGSVTCTEGGIEYKGATTDLVCNGKKGTNGTPGTSVTNTPLTEGNVNCPKGGAELKVGAGTPTYACNGQTGFTATLPSGSTETGSWAKYILPAEEGRVPISFSIPLAATIPSANVLTLPVGYNGEDGVGAEHESCPGKSIAPKAKKGFLCVYVGASVGAVTILGFRNPTVTSASDSSVATTGIAMFMTSTEEAESYGSWAVTAP